MRILFNRYVIDRKGSTDAKRPGGGSGLSSLCCCPLMSRPNKGERGCEFLSICIAAKRCWGHNCVVCIAIRGHRHSIQTSTFRQHRDWYDPTSTLGSRNKVVWTPATFQSQSHIPALGHVTIICDLTRRKLGVCPGLCWPLDSVAGAEYPVRVRHPAKPDGRLERAPTGHTRGLQGRVGDCDVVCHQPRDGGRPAVRERRVPGGSSVLNVGRVEDHGGPCGGVELLVRLVALGVGPPAVLDEPGAREAAEHHDHDYGHHHRR